MVSLIYSSLVSSILLAILNLMVPLLLLTEINKKYKYLTIKTFHLLFSFNYKIKINWYNQIISYIWEIFTQKLNLRNFHIEIKFETCSHIVNKFEKSSHMDYTWYVYVRFRCIYALLVFVSIIQYIFILTSNMFFFLVTWFFILKSSTPTQFDLTMVVFSSFLLQS